MTQESPIAKGVAVLAWYSGDGKYYPATYVRQMKRGHKVRWEDGDYEEVVLYVRTLSEQQALDGLKTGSVFTAMGDRLVTYRVGAEIKMNPYVKDKGYTVTPKKGTRLFAVTELKLDKKAPRIDAASGCVGRYGVTQYLDLTN